jgi:hypothetical protein
LPILGLWIWRIYFTPGSSTEKKGVLLEEHDPVWLELRHAHIGEVHVEISCGAFSVKLEVPFCSLFPNILRLVRNYIHEKKTNFMYVEEQSSTNTYMAGKPSRKINGCNNRACVMLYKETGMYGI